MKDAPQNKVVNGYKKAHSKLNGLFRFAPQTGLESISEDFIETIFRMGNRHIICHLYKD